MTVGVKSFLWKGPLTVKVRKKNNRSDFGLQLSFCFEIDAHLGHLFA